MKLDQALRQARVVGLLVRYVHGTGEWMISCPGARAVRQNARKKEAGRRLLTMIRQAQAGTLHSQPPRGRTQ